MCSHVCAHAFEIALWIFATLCREIFIFCGYWPVSVERIMRARLICNDVGNESTADHLRKNRCYISLQTNGKRAVFLASCLGKLHRLLQRCRRFIEITGRDAPLNSALVHLDANAHTSRQLYGQRLGSAHSTQARGYRDRSLQRSAEVLLGRSQKRFVGPLQNSLRTYVDPRAGGHLAV